MSETVSLDQALQHVGQAFLLPGVYESYEEIKLGHINQTYKINYRNTSGRKKSYMVQKVNTYVFKNPEQVMENIDHVTEHIRKKRPGQISLHFHHTADRKNYLSDETGFWRLFNYIPSVSYDTADSLDIIRKAGVAFGEFQMALDDFEASSLHETIPDFHNTRKRYETFQMHAEEDACGRAAEVSREISYLLQIKDLACSLTDLYLDGQLPLRVTHNDTKFNNVLFDTKSGDALAVVDLDTVMPGIVGNDFGDAIRYAANKIAEDSREYEKAGIDLTVYRSFAEGFLSALGQTLTEKEIETLAISAFALTVECGLRFLDDYLSGDVYFKIDYPDHNLVRARTQLAMAADMEKKLPEMEAIIHDILKK